MFSRSTTALLATVLVLLASTARAQVRYSIGPRLGLNLTTCQYDDAHEGTPGYRTGVEAGLLGSVELGHVALQPALLFSQKGYRQRYLDVSSSGANGGSPSVQGDVLFSERLNYLTLPLHVAYTARRDGQGIQAFAGPYLGLLLNGRTDFTFTSPGNPTVTQSDKITPVGDSGPDLNSYARRFDAGLQAGLGYRYRACLVQLTYGLGLRDIAARRTFQGQYVRFMPYYNRTLQASLTYLFGVKN